MLCPCIWGSHRRQALLPVPYRSNPNSQVRTKHPAVPSWSRQAHPTPIPAGDTASPPGVSQRRTRPGALSTGLARLQQDLALGTEMDEAPGCGLGGQEVWHLPSPPPRYPPHQNPPASKRTKSQTLHFSATTSTSFPAPFFSFFRSVSELHPPLSKPWQAPWQSCAPCSTPSPAQTRAAAAQMRPGSGAEGAGTSPPGPLLGADPRSPQRLLGKITRRAPSNSWRSECANQIDLEH